jgi:hypothetical protein
LFFCFVCSSQNWILGFSLKVVVRNAGGNARMRDLASLRLRSIWRGKDLLRKEALLCNLSVLLGRNLEAKPSQLWL